jgi:CRP-like cAMP-binding protein
MAIAEELLRTTPIFSRLTPADRRTVAEVSRVQHFGKGDLIFEQESPSDAFYAIAAGRVKIFKMMPNGKDLILEVFGRGDPLGPWRSTWIGPSRQARWRSKTRPA